MKQSVFALTLGLSFLLAGATGCQKAIILP